MTADLPLERSHSLPTVLELNRAGTDKGRALTSLIHDLKLDRTELIVAGDGENDLPLFDLATRTFAPEDSPASIRARADHIVRVQEIGLLPPILQHLALG